MESLPTTAAALGCWSRKARLIQQIRFGNAGTLLAHGYDSGYDTFFEYGIHGYDNAVRALVGNHHTIGTLAEEIFGRHHIP